MKTEFDLPTVSSSPNPVGIEGDDTARGIAALEPFLYEQMRDCADCGGPTMFVPVDRFPFGWRGYCLGCEQVVYVVDERTSAA